MNADRASDVKYWGLTAREEIAYFGRVSAYYGRRAAALYAEADRFGRLSTLWGRASIVSYVVLALLLIVRWCV